MYVGAVLPGVQRVRERRISKTRPTTTTTTTMTGPPVANQKKGDCGPDGCQDHSSGNVREYNHSDIAPESAQFATT